MIQAEVMQRVALAMGMLGLCACQNLPEPYAPPPQRTSFGSFRAYRISRVVDMRDPETLRYIASDIQAPTEGWAWTGKHPAVKVIPKSNRNVEMVADLAVAEATFQVTGPVQIRFEVNGYTLATLRVTEPGKQQFTKPVPPEWVRPGQENVVAAEIDKMWTSPGDGAKLGFILTRIGLVEQ